MTNSLVWLAMMTMTVLSGGCRVARAAESMPGARPEQYATSQEQVAAEQPTTTQEQVSPEQQAAAEKLGRPVMETNSMGMKLTLIPAGEFLMGSPSTEVGLARGAPQHRVRITKSFYLGICEVTQAQYEQLMGVNPSSFQGPQRPIETVSWENAVEFCGKLSALPEEKAAGRTYRLPTEAEWEYACRAGSTTRYSYGDDELLLGNYAWFEGNSSSTTHPVGEKQPNAWGLHDMHGNVFEWCEDWWELDYYLNSPVDDPAGPATGSARVLRGGCWSMPASLCRSADRDRFRPSIRFDGAGFRVATVGLADPISPNR
ncbi:MAG: formylglycine-generating enzyme family protein [Pirellulaceae bacterium]